MKNLFDLRIRSLSLLAFLVILLACTMQPRLHAEPPVVLYVQGTYHGFLELLSQDGQVVAFGDSTQVVHGDRVTSQTTFTFKDGSTDEETTVFSQHRTFELISDHHIQKGPFFPHPMEVFVDARSGQFMTRTTGKDGQGGVQDQPCSVARRPRQRYGSPRRRKHEPRRIFKNSLNGRCHTQSARGQTRHLQTWRRQLLPCRHCLARRSIMRSRLCSAELAGFVAPLIGKAPPNIEIWTVTGQAPTFVREQGPIYPDGPVMTIQLVSPTWPDLQIQQLDRSGTSCRP